MKRRWKGWVLAFAGLVALGVAGFLKARGPEVPVRTAERKPLVQTVVVSGRVAAPAQVNLGTTVIGRAVTVPFEEGARVRTGDLVVQLDDGEARAAVDQARAAVQAAEARQDAVRKVAGRLADEELRQANANLALAEQKAKRIDALAANGAATDDDRDLARTALELARSRRDGARSQAAGTAAGGTEARAAAAALAQARANLEAALARLAQMRVVAPADGVVLRRAVEPGDVVQPAAPLVVLAVDGPPHLVVQPDEKNLRLLADGQEGVASADAFPGRPFPVRIQRIAPAVDRQRGTVEVRLAVPEPPAFLKPDMTVSVEVSVARRDDALVIPDGALREAEARHPWVLVVAGNRLERRAVRLGLRGDAVVEVLEGLAAGDRVVVAANGRHQPGDRVRPKEAE